MTSGMRWGRIILAGVLLEVAIVAVAVPVAMAFGSPLDAQPGGPPVDAAVYYVVVAGACFGLGALFGAWAVRGAASGFALRGLLVGLVAMALYFGLCAMAPGGIAGVIAGYGLAGFIMFNALRTLGCVVGAVYRGRGISRAASTSRAAG